MLPQPIVADGQFNDLISAYSRLRLPGAQPFITKQHQKVPGITLEGMSCPSNSHRARENILPASGTSIM